MFPLEYFVLDVLKWFSFVTNPLQLFVLEKPIQTYIKWLIRLASKHIPILAHPI